MLPARDPLAANNERVKLFAPKFDKIGLYLWAVGPSDRVISMG